MLKEIFKPETVKVKTVTFALVHMTVAFGVVYLMTGSMVIGGAVALIEPLCNTVAYFFHERVWGRVLHNRSLQPDGAQTAQTGSA